MNHKKRQQALIFRGSKLRIYTPKDRNHVPTSTCWKTGITQHLHAEKTGSLGLWDWMIFKGSIQTKALNCFLNSRSNLQNTTNICRHPWLPKTYVCAHTQKKTHWVWLMTGNFEATFKLQDWNFPLWLHPPQGFLRYCLNGSVLPFTTDTMKKESDFVWHPCYSPSQSRQWGPGGLMTHSCLSWWGFYFICPKRVFTGYRAQQRTGDLSMGSCSMEFIK